MALLNGLKKASYFALPFCSAKRSGLTRSTRISVALGWVLRLSMFWARQSLGGIARGWRVRALPLTSVWSGGMSAMSFWARAWVLAASSMLGIAEAMAGLGATVSSRICLRRPAMMTWLPSLWKGSARPRPMPEPPPVMRMVLPVVFMVVLSPEAIVGWFVSVGK